MIPSHFLYKIWKYVVYGQALEWGNLWTSISRLITAPLLSWSNSAHNNNDNDNNNNNNNNNNNSNSNNNNNNNGNFICVFECTIVNLATYRQFTNAAWDCIIKKKKTNKQTKTKTKAKKKSKLH